VVLLHDQSAQTAVAACLAESARALHEADQLREAVFLHAALGLVVCDGQGVIRALNPAAERLIGRRAEQVVGQLTLSELHDRDDLPVLADVLRQHLADALSGLSRLQAMRGRGIERTLTYRRPDGHATPVSVTVSALHDGQGQVTGFVCIASDITERVRLADQLSHQAHHDALTGLPNRSLLKQHLAAAIAAAGRDREPLAVLFIDLDGFKAVNDAHGHAVGDAVLCTVAERMRQVLRERDLVARLGGDEFVVVLQPLQREADAVRVADKLLRALTAPVQVAGRALQVGASIGLARHPVDGADVDGLLRAADASMYEVKRAGRPTWAARTGSGAPVDPAHPLS
jgi:diguanylate cyclase (GGDEF)-like protein/PAS domain S-box-containing protein